LSNAAAVDGHERELDADEEGVGRDQQGDGQQAECSLYCWLRLPLTTTTTVPRSPVGLTDRSGLSLRSPRHASPDQSLPMSPAEITLAALILTAACAVQGAVGFGAALLAAPLLILIEPSLVPGPMLVVGFTLNLLMLWREKQGASMHDVAWATTGRIPGNILGAVTLLAISTQSLEAVFGVLTLAAVALSAWGYHFRPTAPSLVGAGVLSGFMGTTISVGGPAMALVYQREKGPVLRGTLARILIIGSVLSLAIVALIGKFGRAEGIAALLLLPGVFIGFGLSSLLVGHLDKGHTKTAVLTLSTIAGVAILVKAAL